MKKESIISNSPADLPNVVKRLLNKYPNNKVFAFYGQMGAGKTTLIREICHLLKVTDNVASPTFSIINEYKMQTDDSVFHFDFYRITKPAEALAIGAEEYLYGGDYCLIEWPEIIESFLPDNTVRVRILVDESGQRREFIF
jgi:tRNA threonylcarbamoyladenosine biosynthesis protein TsaE